METLRSHTFARTLFVGLVAISVLTLALVLQDMSANRRIALAQPAGFAVTVTTDKPQYAPGESVRFTIEVTYSGAGPTTIDRPVYPADFIVHDKNDQVVWRWTQGKMFTLQALQEPWTPGQSRSFSENWDQRNSDGQPVPSGRYTVNGIYSGLFLLSSPASISIGSSSTTGRWIDRPPTSAGASESCPADGQWSLVYWDGDTTAIATAAGACVDADRFWVNRSGRWLGFSKDSPTASDSWQTVRGEAHFVHGKRAGQEPEAASITVSCDDFTNAPAPTGAPKVVTRNIEVGQGQSLVVTLCSNPTTGFQWDQAVIGNPTVIVQTDRRYVPPGSTLVGPPGSEMLTFRAQATGSSTIALDYSRPWEGGEKGVWQFRLTVMVR